MALLNAGVPRCDLETHGLRCGVSRVGPESLTSYQAPPHADAFCLPHHTLGSKTSERRKVLCSRINLGEGDLVLRAECLSGLSPSSV